MHIYIWKMSTYSKFSEQNTTNLPWFMIFSCTPYFCTEPFKYAIFMETKTFFLIALCENLINMSTFTWLKCPQNTFALTKTLHIKGLYNHLNKKDNNWKIWTCKVKISSIHHFGKSMLDACAPMNPVNLRR